MIIFLVFLHPQFAKKNDKDLRIRAKKFPKRKNIRWKNKKSRRKKKFFLPFPKAIKRIYCLQFHFQNSESRTSDTFVWCCMDEMWKWMEAKGAEKWSSTEHSKASALAPVLFFWVSRNISFPLCALLLDSPRNRIIHTVFRCFTPSLSEK